ncbi:hypothetical protein [Streptacidiphilus fuscans]|uniref:Uncharacterized protein n=1 Tax=Streptacidiphilus fuscans TaxID=2789292 RepID=A0A931BAR9_9ACTN|nr:hypothetical protein [Streptacidiphilus fuscans]MBF9071802.1 hypothetical protein [Streptacidiphilus fuscans]
MAAVIHQLLDETLPAAADGAQAPVSAEQFRRLRDTVEALARRLAQQTHFRAMDPVGTAPGTQRALTTGHLRLQAALEGLDAMRRLVRDDDRHAEEVARRTAPVRQHLQETAANLVRDGAEAVEEAAAQPPSAISGAPIGREAVRVAEDTARRLAVVLRQLPRPGENHVGRLELAYQSSSPIAVAAALAAHTRYHAVPADPVQVEAYAAFATALGRIGHCIAALSDAATHQAALAHAHRGHDHVVQARLADSLDDAYVAVHQAVAVLRQLADATTVGGTSPTPQVRNTSLGSGVPQQRRRR